MAKSSQAEVSISSRNTEKMLRICGRWREALVAPLPGVGPEDPRVPLGLPPEPMTAYSYVFQAKHELGSRAAQ
jgi:hypothetical protein